MVDTVGTKSTNSDTKGGSVTRDIDNKTNAKGVPISQSTNKGTAREDTSNTKEREDVSSEEEKAQREEDEARSNGLKYASKVNEAEEPQGLESEADQSSASWLVANGYAEMHSIQEGVDTTNYILLTEEGRRALSTYNEEEE